MRLETVHDQLLIIFENESESVFVDKVLGSKVQNNEGRIALVTGSLRLADCLGPHYLRVNAIPQGKPADRTERRYLQATDPEGWYIVIPKGWQNYLTLRLTEGQLYHENGHNCGFECNDCEICFGPLVELKE